MSLPESVDWRTATHIEFQLAWLIVRARLSTTRPDRRLNALENLIAAAARSWRTSAQSILVRRDLRVSRLTLGMIRTWVEAGEPVQGDARARLEEYACVDVVDDAVPAGWVRLRLP